MTSLDASRRQRRPRRQQGARAGMAMALRFAGWPFVWLVLCQLLRGLSPAALLWLMGRASSGHPIPTVTLLVAVGVLLMIEDAAESYLIVLLTQARDRVDIGVRRAYLSVIANWPDLSLHESSSFIRLRLEAAQAVERMGWVTTVFSNLTGGLLAVVPLIALGLSVNPLLPLLIIVGAIPVTRYSLVLENKMWDAEASHVAQVQRADGYARSASAPEYAKDLRALRLSRWAVDAWRRERMALFAVLQGIRTRGARTISLLSMVSVLASMVGLVVVLHGTNAPAATVVVTLGLLIQLRTQLYVVVGNVSNIGELRAPLRALTRFLTMEPPALRDAAPSVPSSGNSTDATGGISVDDVSFRYPDADRLALEHVTMAAEPGALTTIVGANGAGKSTLIKLLAGLYPSHDGLISLGGADQLAVMHQDFARFPMTLRENLLCAREYPATEVDHVLGLAGLTDWFEQLPDGLDTPLYLSTEGDGTQLSGGQWQRLALARTLLLGKVCGAVLLDEPTSALDAFAEADVLTAAVDYLRGSTVILVTHRLNQAARSDRVIVVENGTVTAQGTPSEVFERSAWYRDAYRLQAGGYDAHNVRAASTE